jgi:uroporphyrinogen-III decarboxylase
MGRSQEKTSRVMKAMHHEEPDRIPAIEWFAGEFTTRWVDWRKTHGHVKSDEKVLTASWAAVIQNEELDPTKFYDMDLALAVPNSDPRFITPEVTTTDEYTIATSGFGCTIKKRNSRLEDGYMAPMAEYIDFSIKSPDDYAKFEFEDPKDPRRFFKPRQDILSGDGFTVLPSYMDGVNSLKEDCCLIGGIYEAWEGLWRMRGISNAMMDMAREPEKVKAFCNRLIDFAIGSMQEQVRLSQCPLMYIWGDLGYKTGLMFSPRMWRDIFFPPLKRLVDAIHKEGALAIYHSCGHNPDSTVEGLIEAGIDGLNPLEVKAGMDALHIKRKYGDQLVIVGGIDNAHALGAPAGDFETIRKQVLTTMNAAKGGGLILQTDHSVPGSVPPENYDYYQKLRREFGNYPLHLGEYDQSL